MACGRVGVTRVFGRMPRWLKTAAIALAACALLMGPVALFGGFTLRTSLEDLNARSDSERRSGAALAAALVERTIATRAEQLRLVSSRDDLYAALVRGEGGRLSDIFAPIVSGVSDVATAGVLDPSGKVIARFPVDPTAIGVSFADRDFYAGAMRSEGVFIGDAVTSRIDPALTIVTLSYAVREGSVVRGITILSIRPTTLIADLRAAFNNPGRELLLVDHRSATIASTSQRPMLSLVDVPTKAGQGLASFDGSPRAFVGAPISGAQWTLYVLDDPALIYAAQRTLVTQLGGPLALSIVVAGVLAALLASVWLLLTRGQQRLAAANVQQRELNAAVHGLNSALEHNVSELRALNDELGAFAYSVSHDLRAPLRSIDGFSQILLEDKGAVLGDDGRQHLDRVRAAAVKMGALIDDMLLLSRLTRDEMRVENVDVTGLARSVVDDLRGREPQRHVEFESNGATPAQGDARLVRIALTNLLGNSWKFTRQRTPAHISFGGEARDGETVFFVKDDGVGFDMRYADKLFGAFQRLHNTSEFEGTGIGLATVQRIVHRHGGRVWAESEVGKGTTFYFTLGPPTSLEMTPAGTVGRHALTP
jgi:signal transduction histidine kinase